MAAGPSTRAMSGVIRMSIAQLTVDPRYFGMPGLGNGGYVAGLLASFAIDTVEVRLRSPVPLGVALDLCALEGGALELRHGEVRLATAEPAELELEVPASIGAEVAHAASLQYRGHLSHASPTCFVCGPARSDGLRIFPGPTVIGGRDAVAATWCPDPALAGTRGKVRPEFIAAALDCPGYSAAVADARPMLLGRFTCLYEGTVAVGETCVVAAWRIGGEGRKHRVATVLYGADGRTVARARGSWIELRAVAKET